MLRKAGWLRNPEAVVRAVFAADGTVASFLPNFKENPVQTEYAVSVAQTAARSASQNGRVTMVEAGAGIGKTLGYLIPGLINAVLTGRRTMISTYTLHLQRQLIGEDGQIAAGVVEALTGIRPTFAARRARSQFASPNKCRALADAIRSAGNPQDASALEDLAQFAEAAIALAERVQKGSYDGSAYIAAGEGLIDAWAEDNPDLHARIADRDRDLYALDLECDGPEQSQWAIYQEHSQEANCLVTTHASTLIDLRLNGLLHRNQSSPFGLVVIDEADRLTDAAASQFGMQTSLATLKKDVEGIHLAARDEPDPTLRIEAVNAASDLDAAYAELTTQIERWQNSAEFGAQRTTQVTGTEPWLGQLRSLSRTLGSAIATVDRLQTVDAIDLTRVLQSRHIAIEHFIDAVDGPDGQGNGHQTAAIGRTIPLLQLSRVRSHPVLAARHVNGARIVARLWRPNRAEQTRATNVDAIFLTSATLSDPSKDPALAFRNFQDEVGLNFTPQQINADLCKVLEPTSFGNPTFVLAHPAVPVKPHPEAENYARDLKAWHSYLASVVREAASRPTERGTSRIMVLVTAHSDAEAIADLLNKDLGNRLLVRRAGKNGQVARIGTYIDQLQKNDDAILISAGAWEGVSVKGIDHVIVAKLPFPNPSGDLNAFRRVADTNKTTMQMMRRLRQGIARGIRQATDAPTIWIADPRFGLPERLRAKLRLPDDASEDYSAAVPARFRDKLRRAEVFPPSL